MRLLDVFFEILNKLFRKMSASAGIIGISILVYVFTTHPFLAQFRFQILYVFLFALILTTFLVERTKTLSRNIKVITLLLTSFVLSAVGATGWFQSPFAFTLYFLVVMIAFVYPPGVALTLVVMLFMFVLITLPHGDPTNNFLTVLSLLTIIPVTFYLREQFLRLKEAEKSILMLKKRTGPFSDEIDEMLSNIMTRFAAKLRGKLTTIKQLAHRTTTLTDTTKKKYTEKMLTALIDETIHELNRFEEETTNEKLLSSPKTVVPGKLTDAVKGHF